ncbi:MAG TPA: hypothetical protein VIL18_00080 [Longimicrobiales bacterium]
MVAEPADERILRAKYLDWCSAQVADRFLRLTPDEIYELAHGVPPGGGDIGPYRALGASGGPGAEGSLPGTAVSPAAVLSLPEPEAPGLSYRALVQRVTEALTASMSLPPFEQWVAIYREAPERFESEMLGFWEDDREPRADQ